VSSTTKPRFQSQRSGREAVQRRRAQQPGQTAQGDEGKQQQQPTEDPQSYNGFVFHVLP